MEYNLLKESSVYIGAGAFADYGGWVLDTQFIPNIGSAYLLAHGLGEPVANAKTSVRFPAPGNYRLWAFTRDWVAPWKTDCAPGLFKIRVDGIELDTIFGNENAKWHWQYGGRAEIKNQNSTIELHDLTGFEGRVAALFFTMDEDFSPPDNIDELIKFSRELSGNDKEEYAGKFDIVVAGGGIAGICAALSAARNGLSVALVQDRPVVGGNNSSEVRVWLSGKTNFEPYPKVGNIVLELEQEVNKHYGSENTGEIYEDDKKLDLLKSEKNITLFMEYFLNDCQTEDGIIKSACLYDVKGGGYKRIEADLFVDATGDGVLGYKSGADFEVTTNGHMGMTNAWHVKDTGVEQEFPSCPWAIDLSKSLFPGRGKDPIVYSQTRDHALGVWYWESGCEHDPIEKAEYARDTNFRAMYGAWDCVKNTDGDYKTYKLNHCSYIGGKRESRRLFGDVILNKSDVKNDYKFEDACVPSYWKIDVHYPNRKFYSSFHEGDAFLTTAYFEPFKRPYFIPYRCLYSRNVKNLFMAGRNVSTTHDALGTVRVMRTGGMMGEVIGKAAAICKAYNALPRDVYEKYLSIFLKSLSE